MVLQEVTDSPELFSPCVAWSVNAFPSAGGAQVEKSRRQAERRVWPAAAPSQTSLRFGCHTCEPPEGPERARPLPREWGDSRPAGGQAAAPPTRAWVWLKGVSVLDFAISGVVCPPPWSPKTPDSNPGASKFHTRESRRNASRSPSVRMRPVPNCGGKRAPRHLSCSTNQGHLLMPFFSCVPT